VLVILADGSKSYGPDLTHPGVNTGPPVLYLAVFQKKLFVS
jgi:hypothetical protein